MPRIYVDFGQFKQLGNECKSISSKIGGIRSDLQNTVNKLDWDVKYMSDINNTAKQLARKLDNQAQALKSYQKFINEAHDKYKKLENVRDNYLYEVVFKELDLTMNNLGLIANIKDVPLPAWLGKFLKGVGKIPDWTGFVFSAALNAYGNFVVEEHSSWNRMWSEFFMETAIDFAIGLAILGAGAVVLVSAPVIAVPIALLAIGGSVWWAVNDMTERTSDTILDGLESSVDVFWNWLESSTGSNNQPKVAGGGYAW